MAKVFLGIGSNIEPVSHLRFAVAELTRRFGAVGRSAVYRNAPVGFEGDDFLNMVAVVRSELAPRQILGQLEEIHALAGRTDERDGAASRELDIDLLLYDRPTVDDGDIELPRSDVLEYDFVLRPLVEMAPDYVHPRTGRRLADHWQEMAVAERLMEREPVSFD